MNYYRTIAGGAAMGIIVEGRATPGQVVVVTKKSGIVRIEVVSRVLCFAKGHSICTIKVAGRVKSRDLLKLPD